MIRNTRNGAMRDFILPFGQHRNVLNASRQLCHIRNEIAMRNDNSVRRESFEDVAEPIIEIVWSFIPAVGPPAGQVPVANIAEIRTNLILNTQTAECELPRR
jgi:hypothetical protein